MKKRGERRAVTQRVFDAGRELGAAAVLFHSAVAEKQGLGATEEKTLDLLQRFGPLTAGELSAKSGLAPASVTGLVDRLERKGFVRRSPDPADRRRVRIELDEARLQAFVPLFADFMEGLTAVCARYSVDELAVVARFMKEAARCQLDAASKLSGLPPEG